MLRSPPLKILATPLYSVDSVPTEKSTTSH